MPVVKKCIRCQKYLTEDEQKTDEFLDPEDSIVEPVLCNECYEFENQGAGDDE